LLACRDFSMYATISRVICVELVRLYLINTLASDSKFTQIADRCAIIWSIGPRNKSGAILQPCLTPLPTANQSNNTPSAQTQLRVSVYRASMRSTTLLCRTRPHSSFHKTLRSTESKAALRSTKAIQIGL